MTINSISNSAGAIQKQGAALDRAASRVLRATLAESHPQAGKSTGAAPGEAPVRLEDATVDLMVSKRMFTAAVRMAQTANEGVLEALRTGGYETAA
jgi:hypothetical protein